MNFFPLAKDTRSERGFATEARCSSGASFRASCEFVGFFSEKKASSALKIANFNNFSEMRLGIRRKTGKFAQTIRGNVGVRKRRLILFMTEVIFKVFAMQIEKTGSQGDDVLRRLGSRNPAANPFFSFPNVKTTRFSVG